MAASLHDLFAKYPDTDKDTIHSYADLYETLLRPIHARVLNVLEIGVRGGGSLCAWREFFPAAQVIGIDNGSEAGMWGSTDPHIIMRYGDSTRPHTLYEVAREFGPFDLIIDDGCHTPLVQAATWGALFPHLRQNGLYIIEDVEGITHANDFASLFGGVVYDRRHVKSRHDDILLVWRKWA